MRFEPSMAPGRRMPKLLLLNSFLLLAVCSPSVAPVASASQQDHCKAWLVQSIPTDMPHLRRVPGVLSSADVLRWLAGNATRKLDIMAQYWELLAQPENPKSGDYGYSSEDMERFGAGAGRRVYEALLDAADRSVDIRIVQHSGLYPDYDKESAQLAAGRSNVKNATLVLGDWWGSGIVHAKVWISDKKDMYIGSANNDWKSLTQVKEVGIYLVNCPDIARTLEIYYDNLWKLAYLNSSFFTKKTWDEQWQANREVPCWSHFIYPKHRCRSPLPSYVEIPHTSGYPQLSDPSMFNIPFDTPGYSKPASLPYLSYLSFAPPELLFGEVMSDEQAWLDTIKSVKIGGTVRISTMDWLGQSEYLGQTVYWSSLSNSISEVVFSKNATVKILVAYWAHTIENTDQYLKLLLYTNTLCRSSKYNSCGGKLQIKYYEVPGFNRTGPAVSGGNATTGNIYPGYTRVNHGKYAVSDVRAHVGTSNLVWDYFYTTAGVSFGTYNQAVVEQLQDIFDADWYSPYAADVVQPLHASMC